MLYGVDMLIDTEVQRIFSELVKFDHTQIKLSGEVVSIRIFDNGGKFSLSTSVFRGGSYLPDSVRQCVSENLQIGSGLIETSLQISEKEYKVLLHHLGVTSILNPPKFKCLLEEFNWIAEEWRYVLDERGRRDLIHVPAK